MSVPRGVRLVVLAVLVAVGLAGCSADIDGSSGGLVSGPTPPPRPGAYVWVCGAPDLIIGSADGGAIWQQRNRRADEDIMSGDLWGIAFGDADHGWAVRRGVAHEKASLLASTDAGRTWTEQSVDVSNGRLLAVAATDARHVWAVGYQYVEGSDYPPGKGLVLASSDGGATWTRQRLPAGLSPFRVAFGDPHHGWLLAENADHSGGYHVLSTSDGGTHWRVSHTALQGVFLRDIAPLGSKGCCVVGYGEHPQTGFVARTTDGGQHWTPEASVTPKGLLAVSFPEPRSGWAVGNDGTAVATTDGGATWKTQNTGVGHQLRQVSFSDLEHGWALIGHKALLTTGDGGRTWSVVLPTSSRSILTGLATVNSPPTGDQ